MKRLLAILFSALAVAACALSSACTATPEVKLSYYYYYGSDYYNTNLFYENELDTVGADPDVIYISEGEETGWYYMYITSDDIGSSGFIAYKSKDMVDWENAGVALKSTGEYDSETGYTSISFGFTYYWAPEVIYDGDDKLYYMFYTAAAYSPDFSDVIELYADIAVSENPYGPFVQYNRYFAEETGYKPLRDEEHKLLIYEPVFDFSDMDADDPLYETNTDGYMKVIDVNPFVDPVTGKKYMYFCRDLGKQIAVSESSVYVIALNDDWLPDYGRVNRLTAPNRYSLDGESDYALNEGSVNEAPYMVYNDVNGLYYLFFSVNNYLQKTYSVRVAVGDSPDGAFRKLSAEEGGFVLYAESYWSWASGTGHCSVVNRDGQDYIFYHAHTDRVNGNSERAVAIDELNWVENDSGLLVPVVNGPSYAVMPKTTEEYKNIAAEASVKATNLASGSSAKYINDGIIPNHSVSFLNECVFEKGSAKITLTFDTYREITAVSVFNSYDYDLMFGKIKNITFEFSDNGVGKAYTGELLFDWERYYTEDGYVIPNGNFSIEFAPMYVKSITVEISGMASRYAVSEIYVTGK